MRAIDSFPPINKVRVKTKSKPWFDSNNLSNTKRDKLYPAYKNSDFFLQKYFLKRCYT